MSYEAMAWAVDLIDTAVGSQLTSPVRFVLLMMANRADEEGRLFPSVSWLAQRTALSERKVRSATAELEAIGFLRKRFRRQQNGEGQTSNEYQLAMGAFQPAGHRYVVSGRHLQRAPRGDFNAGGRHS